MDSQTELSQKGANNISRVPSTEHSLWTNDFTGATRMYLGPILCLVIDFKETAALPKTVIKSYSNVSLVSSRKYQRKTYSQGTEKLSENLFTFLILKFFSLLNGGFRKTSALPLLPPRLPKPSHHGLSPHRRPHSGAALLVPSSPTNP